MESMETYPTESLRFRILRRQVQYQLSLDITPSGQPPSQEKSSPANMAILACFMIAASAQPSPKKETSLWEAVSYDLRRFDRWLGRTVRDYGPSVAIFLCDVALQLLLNRAFGTPTSQQGCSRPHLSDLNISKTKLGHGLARVPAHLC